MFFRCIKYILFSSVISFNTFAVLEFTGGALEAEVPFASPGNSTTLSVSITNLSGIDVATNLSGSFTNTDYNFLGGSFPGIGGSCMPASLAANDSCTLMIEFSPTSTGDADDDFEVNYDFPSIFGTQNITMSIKLDGHSENVGSGSCPDLQPVISSVSPSVIQTSSTTTINITGANFSASTTIDVPGLTTSSLNITDYGNLSFDLATGATETFYDLEITNECGTTTSTSAIEIRASTWLDLRIPANLAAANPVFTTGATGITSTTVNASFGLQVTNAQNNWNKFLRFDGACGSVSQDFDIVIYKQGNVRRSMYGLWNSATQVNPYPGSNSYQRQYTGFWDAGNQTVNRTYGTQLGEGGSSWSQGFTNTSIADGSFYRFHFKGAGQNGQTIEIWRVDTNLNDLALLRTYTSNKPATPATNVCPGIAPFDAGASDYYITAVRVL